MCLRKSGRVNNICHRRSGHVFRICVLEKMPYFYNMCRGQTDHVNILERVDKVCLSFDIALFSKLN